MCFHTLHYIRQVRQIENSPAKIGIVVDKAECRKNGKTTKQTEEFLAKEYSEKAIFCQESGHADIRYRQKLLANDDLVQKVQDVFPF